MKIVSGQNLNCIEGGLLKIEVETESHRKATVHLNLSKISAMLCRAMPLEESSDQRKDWLPIEVLSCSATAKTTHYIAVSMLNGIIDGVEKRGFEVKQAVDHGDSERLKRLLQSGTITDEDLAAALHEAASGGNINIVIMLLDGQLGAKAFLLEKNLAKSLEAAAAGGHMMVVSLLLNKQEITPDHRALALNAAAAGGHERVLSMFLDQEGITPEHRGLAVEKAAEGGYRQVVHLLINKEEIRPAYRGKALVVAALYGHKDVVSLLLEKEDIPAQDLEEAVKLAA
jgi:hypothetical protein